MPELPIDILNRLDQEGELKRLFMAGLISPTVFLIIDACNLYRVLRKVHNYTESRFIICERLRRSESSVDAYLKKGGVR